jgi:hypothetical protein
MWGVAAGAVALGIVGASVAVAGLVAGGGPTKSDCYAEWDIKGIDAGDSQRVKNNKQVLCTDGTACDADKTCNGTCVVQVKQCWNQRDPRLSDCTPPEGLDSLKVKGALNVQIPPLLEGASCLGAFVDVSVATKKGGKKPGKKNFKVTAKGPKGTKPRTDTDNYQLVCLPNTVPETCGASPSGAFLN